MKKDSSNIRVLFVGREHKGQLATYVEDQISTLQLQGNIVTSHVGIKYNGIIGFINAKFELLTKIRSFSPDIIHAHYGLSGLLSCLQKCVPVVVTYHGSDINNPKVLRLSQIAIRRAAWNIFVSERMVERAQIKVKNYTVLPCGIDLTDEQLTSKAEARKQMRLDADRQYVLFAGAFDNAVKNSALAKEAVSLYNYQTGSDCQLIELRGYSRKEVNRLMCAADAFLLTSHKEGSPQVVKEAMACGCPIVSVDVGDVAERLQGVEGCFVAKNYQAEELANLLQKAIQFNARTNGRERIIEQGLDNRQVVQRLMKIYQKVCKQK